MTQIPRIVQETRRGGRIISKVRSPIINPLGAADGEDEDVKLVDGRGFYYHSFCTRETGGRDVDCLFAGEAGGRVVSGC